MSVSTLIDWLDDQTSANIFWFVKRLSGNDTLANGSHQAGPYIPRDILLEVFPSLKRSNKPNPDKWFELYIDSHPEVRSIRAIWYNNAVLGKGTRNETRLTNFGGKESILLDPESTGSLVVFAFHRDEFGEASSCHVWKCDNEIEEDLVEERVGPIEPGRYRLWAAGTSELLQFGTSNSNCSMTAAEIPQTWLSDFPSGEEIVKAAIERRRDSNLPVDTRLIRRRDCEFAIYQSLEAAIELPHITQGFPSVDAFIQRAQTVLQRRKARSGRSLELHIREIFREEYLQDNIHFAYQAETESNKKPDFIFPSQRAYQDPNYPSNQLRILAVKTTCKDRWRQVLNEANRISQKHLLTLQEGISEKQFHEMCQANITLVVPQPLHSKFASSIQPHLQTLESFLADIRLLNLQAPTP